jgi:hypothetical protein
LRALRIGVLPTGLPRHAESALRAHQNVRFWAILEPSAITYGSREFVMENECLRRLSVRRTPLQRETGQGVFAVYKKEGI